MRQNSVNVCLSIGMTIIIIAGGIDLSVGSILALAGAITAGLTKTPVPISWLGIQLNFTVGGGILAGPTVGMFLGWFKVQMITRVRIPPFVATLGMVGIAPGLTMLRTKGLPITGLGSSPAMISAASFLGAPVPVWIAGLLAVGLMVGRGHRRHVSVRRSRFDRGNGDCLSVIGVLNNGLLLLDVCPFWQQVVKGVVILAAVAIDRLKSGEEK